MSSPFLMINGWTIDSWTPDEEAQLPEGIPTNGVKVDSPLDITPDPSDSSLFDMSWRNQLDQVCSVSGLHSDQEQTMLQGQNRAVTFGDKRVQCDLTVALTEEPGHLRCRIDLPEFRLRGIESGVPDTGGGTFTATANPGG
jgi:hypothetical protein